MFKRSHLARIALVSTTLACASEVHAQAFDAIRLYAAEPGKDGGLAGFVLLPTTEYSGSDERRTLVLPVLDYQWASGWFAGTTNGLGHNFSKRPDTQYGLRVTADFGRKESRSSALRGMGDIDAKAEVGGFYNVAMTDAISLSTSLRYGAGSGSDGLVADFGINYSLPIAPRWRVSVGGAVTLADKRYMQSYFGVSREQAASSAYAATTPSGGVRDARAGATLIYSVSPRTSLTLGLSASTLLGDAADSPLVEEKTTVGGLLAATVSF